MKLALDTVGVEDATGKLVAYFHVTDDAGAVLQAFSLYYTPDDQPAFTAAVKAKYDAVVAHINTVEPAKSAIAALVSTIT